jgi:hypothetical protein
LLDTPPLGLLGLESDVIGQEDRLVVGQSTGPAVDQHPGRDKPNGNAVSPICVAAALSMAAFTSPQPRR